MKTHREIAEQLDLFHSEVDGPGMIFWHPNGWRLFQSVQNHMRNIYNIHGFVEINAPIFLKKNLWQISGHLDKFAENMFVGGEFNREPEYALKPMSCPAHILFFKRGVYSYRDLPFRVFEFGTVHRNEPSGSLNGCLRLRQFTQDDAHVFCQWEQAEQEIKAFLARANMVYGCYGYSELEVKISTRPQNSFGEQVDWDKAETILASACKAAGYEFEFQVGEGAFYGPKIELSLKDAMGRSWQCGTIQLDFNLPGRFDIHYVAEENQYCRPVILHQAMYGSIERWIAILLETYQGKLPPWVHPLPVALASVKESVNDYVNEIEHQLKKSQVPFIMDVSKSTLARKMKNFHKHCVPFILVVGEKEKMDRSVSVRFATSGEQQQLNLEDLIKQIRQKLSIPNDSVN